MDEDLLIAGVVVRDYPVMTSARRKAIRAVGKGAVSKNEIQSAIDHAAKASKELEERFRRKQDELIAEYRDSKGYQAEIVEQLRPDIERALAQVHDYKQFVQQIVQNVNVILSERYPGENIDAQLAQATHEEVAIYWAARLMEEKLDAVLYVRYPERILEAREWARFRFHGLVTKYVKIYQRRLEQRDLKLEIRGESHSDVQMNARAASVMPHTLIDNAIKYAPQNTRVVLNFSEDGTFIKFSVASYGPLIHADEMKRIFDPFFRGREATTRDSEGTGFGLAAAQTIAKAHGIEIVAKQDSLLGPEDCRWTTFSMSIPIA